MIPMPESTNSKGDQMAVDPALLEQMLFLPKCYFDYVGDRSHSFVETTGWIKGQETARRERG